MPEELVQQAVVDSLRLEGDQLSDPKQRHAKGRATGKRHPDVE